MDSELDFESETQVKNAIAITAINNDWEVCDCGNDTLRVSTQYKKNWQIVADVRYDALGYTIKPNVEFTNLKDENGNVHKNVNRLVKVLYNQINLRLNRGDLSKDPMIRVDPCLDYTFVNADSSGLPYTGRHFVQNSFAWIGDSMTLPQNTKFAVKIETVAGIPHVLIDSMQARMENLLGQTGNYAGKGDAEYVVTVIFSDFDEQSKGENYDFFMFNNSKQEMRAEALISRAGGDGICAARTFARVNLDGIGGLVNRRANKITEVLAEGLWGTLSEKVLDKGTK